MAKFFRAEGEEIQIEANNGEECISDVTEAKILKEA
jgi:hypothetical protein